MKLVSSIFLSLSHYDDDDDEDTGGYFEAGWWRGGGGARFERFDSLMALAGARLRNLHRAGASVDAKRKLIPRYPAIMIMCRYRGRSLNRHVTLFPLGYRRPAKIETQPLDMPASGCIDTCHAAKTRAKDTRAKELVSGAA